MLFAFLALKNQCILKILNAKNMNVLLATITWHCVYHAMNIIIHCMVSGIKNIPKIWILHLGYMESCVFLFCVGPWYESCCYRQQQQEQQQITLETTRAVAKQTLEEHDVVSSNGA